MKCHDVIVPMVEIDEEETLDLETQEDVINYVEIKRCFLPSYESLVFQPVLSSLGFRIAICCQATSACSRVALKSIVTC